MRELDNALEDTRRITREALVEFWMVPAERVRPSALTAEGLDAEIAALCAPFDLEEDPKAA